MRMLLMVLLACVSTTIAAVSEIGVAGACSCGNDCETAVHKADLIVEGRITGWERAPGYFGTDYAVYTPILVDLDVSRVFKGRAPNPVTMVDGASLQPVSEDGAKIEWAGAGGGCGSFDEEPTGLHVIAALYRDERGTTG